MSTRARILGTVVGGGTLILLAAWWGSRGEHAPNPASFPAHSRVATDPPATELIEPAAAVELARDAAQVEGAVDGVVATGTLVVRVEDAASDAPLAGIEVRIGRERGGDKHLASALTDAGGEVRFEAVEANAVIVEARRSPPYARTFSAAWLEAGEVERVVVRMSTGSMVRGRVVDDLEAPVGDAEILLDSDLHPRFGSREDAFVSTNIATRTDSDGRFELRHVAPEPREVWIERGAMAPRRWNWAALHVRLGDALVRAEIRASEERIAGQDIELPDIVLARAAEFRGIVVKDGGDQVANVLLTTLADCEGAVSVRCAHRKPRPVEDPGAAGFRLFPGETRSRVDGTFALTARAEAQRIQVRTASGMRHEFALPAATPGSKHDGLRFELPPTNLLVLELVDARGAPVTAGRSGSFPHLLEAKVRLAHGDFVGRLAPEIDKTFRLQLSATDGEPKSLHLRLGGYVPVELDLASQSSGRLRIVLDELPSLELRVRFEDPPPSVLAAKGAFWLRAVLASNPDARFGFGGMASVQASREPREVGIALEFDAPHVVIVGRFGDSWSRTYGPWSPGPDVHEIVIPHLDPIPAGPPVPEPAIVRLVVREVGTGTRLEPEIQVEEPPGSGDWSERVSWSAKGAAFRQVPSGPRRIRITSRDHVPADPMETNFAPGSEHDLGVVDLAPLPEQRVQVIPAEEGGPLAPDVRIGNWYDAQSGVLPVRPVRVVDGLGTVFGDVSAAQAVLVSEMLEDGPEGRRWQTAALERRADGVIEVRLEPWVRVEVRVPASGDVERAARIAVLAHVRGPLDQEFHELAPEPGVRRFAAFVPRGSARILAEGPLHPRREKVVELEAGASEPVVVELAP